LVELLELRAFDRLYQEEPGRRQHDEEKAGDDA
jgi:hypothetical protein